MATPTTAAESRLRTKTQCSNLQCKHPRTFHPQDGPCRSYACKCSQMEMPSENGSSKSHLAKGKARPGTIDALIEQNPEILSDLKNTDLGPTTVALRWPKTSETAVRRWRKNNLS